jgi:hypothetical protein
MHLDGLWRATGHPSDRALYFFSTFPLCPSPCDYKGRGEQPLQGLDLLQIEHHFKGLGSDTLSRPVCNHYYKHPWPGNKAARHWT